MYVYIPGGSGHARLSAHGPPGCFGGMFLIFHPVRTFVSIFRSFPFSPFFHTVATYVANIIRVILPLTATHKISPLPTTHHTTHYIINTSATYHKRTYTRISQPKTYSSQKLKFFLKVCAFDETLVLLAFFFTGTETYVPVESISKKMAVLAAATTPSFGHFTPNENDD